ncbi:MAG: sensor histidine kinase/response regulator, partial [Verrucomicrobiales bacterium]|nr:sensor histidine kinase/response regulator [Verrucomicrobiales bacterium]
GFLPDQNRRFYVRTGTDGRAALADLAGVRNQALIASALTALAGLLVLVILARLVTRRLRQVAEALGRFETGGPAAPLPEAPPDEIGQLAAAFNRMSGKIADQVRTLEEARGRADEASRAKDDFLAVMSHEIRTPLNAVTGMLHVLERNRPAPHQEPILRSLHAAASQLTSLLNEALDWSKIKAGRLVCDDLPFDPRELLSDLELTHRPLAAQKGLKWTTVIPPDLPDALSGDRLRISQVLHNLLSNAVKFTDSGFVRLTASWQENQLTVRVEDSGIGIREEDIGRIFSPFDQANGEIGRRFGGTGLGLSISRSLAELMGGRLTVESRVDDGSCFVLTLPCQASTRPAPASEPRPADPLRRGAHVLCVEDSAMNREVLASFLDEAGITCEMAGDGASALRILTENTEFDAALLDLQLPDTNGIDLAARILHLRPGLPLLAVTAQADEDTRTACLAAGMRDVVTKPIQPRRLIDAISEALGAAPGPLPPTEKKLPRIALPDPEGTPHPALSPASDPAPPAPLLTEIFAHEPERLARVLKALAGEFSAAIPELAAAAESGDITRLRRLRHKLHSAIAGLRLTELDAAFQQLIAGHFSRSAPAIALLAAAAETCAAPRDDAPGAAPAKH